MSNVEKLSKLFDADVYIFDINSQDVSVLHQQDYHLNVNISEILLKKSTMFFEHTYTSIDHALGYIIVCKVSQSKFICFSFFYEKQTSSTNELNVLRSLHNLKMIAQIIFSMYSNLAAPDEEVFIIKTSRPHQKNRDHQGEFDTQLFFQVETEVIKAIIYSKKSHLIDSLDKLSELNITPSILSSNNIVRAEKNALIAYISILNRAIIQWGYPAKLAFKIQYNLIREIELSSQFSNFFQTIKKFRGITLQPLKIIVLIIIFPYIREFDNILNSISERILP